MLEARNLSKSFGGVRAVDSVTFTIGAGEVVGLTGPNGAGKSVLVGMLAGRDEPDEGDVFIRGVPVNRRMQDVFSTYQLGRVFPAHTIEENLRLGTEVLVRALPASEWGFATERLSQAAGTLSVGERRRIALAWLKARIGQTAVFLLDEPTAGGDRAYIDELLNVLRAIKRAGGSVLVVEHNLDALSAVADRQLSMLNGRLVNRPASDGNPRVPRPATSDNFGANPGLEARNVSVSRGGSRVLTNTSLGVAPGEIMGIIGPNGKGKSTLLRALYGDPACRLDGGTIYEGGVQLRPGDIKSRVFRGIHLLPQERVAFSSLTARENLRLAADVSGTSAESVSPERLFAIIPRLQQVWNRPAGSLSGGERRLVGLARIAALRGRYVLLDEPTAGLDEEGRAVAATILRNFAVGGTGVIVAEQNQQFLDSIADRIVSIQNGGSNEHQT